MKKIILLIMVLLMAIIPAHALTFDPVIEEIGMTIPSFVVIGGDTGADEVLRGEVLNDVTLKTRITESNTAFCQKTSGGTYEFTGRLDVYFQIGTSGTKHQMKSFYIRTKRNIGDIVNYKVSNLDTSDLPTSFTNKGITVGATHYVCQADRSVLQGKWVIDDNYYGAYRGTNDDFTLLSPNNPCERKSLGETCYLGDVAEEYQTVRQNSDGSCEKQYSFTDRCPDKCVDAKCVTSLTVGSTKCSIGNAYVQTWDGSKWDLSVCVVDGVGYCDDGVCRKPTPPADTKQCECETGAVTTVKCQDGQDAIAQRCDGCNFKDVKLECKQDQTVDPKYESGVICDGKYDEFQAGECSFSFKKFISPKETSGKLIAGFGALLIVGLIAFIIYRKK